MDLIDQNRSDGSQLDTSVIDSVIALTASASTTATATPFLPPQFHSCEYRGVKTCVLTVAGTEVLVAYT